MAFQTFIKTERIRIFECCLPKIASNEIAILCDRKCKNFNPLRLVIPGPAS